jgi:hypothetical protein
VLEIRRGNVRLGFEASKGVLVHREEVCERMGTTGPSKRRGAIAKSGTFENGSRRRPPPSSVQMAHSDSG